MEQFVLQLWYFLHLLGLLYLHLQELYREAFLGTTGRCLAVASTSIIEIRNTFTLFLFLGFLRSEDIEDRPWNMLLIEVNFIWLPALFAQARRHSDCHWFREWLIFGFGIELLSEIDKFEFEFIENIELFLVEEVFIIGDPHIVELDVVKIV